MRNWKWWEKRSGKREEIRKKRGKLLENIEQEVNLVKKTKLEKGRKCGNIQRLDENGK